jgi:thiol-disulfide isomerase/thioredoxin
VNRILTLILTLILASGLVITSCSSGGGGATPTSTGLKESPEVGKLAPNFELQNTEGKTITLSDLRGKPVLINFWATWCGPCFLEQPFLQEVYNDWSKKGLVFLSIDIGQNAQIAQAYLDTNNFTFPVLLDNKSTVAMKYAVQYLPTTFLVDKDGIIVKTNLLAPGAFESREQIEKEWLSLVFPELQ